MKKCDPNPCPWCKRPVQVTQREEDQPIGTQPQRLEDVQPTTYVRILRLFIRCSHCEVRMSEQDLRIALVQDERPGKPRVVVQTLARPEHADELRADLVKRWNAIKLPSSPKSRAPKS